MARKKVLLLGATGQVGGALARSAPADIELIVAARHEFDLVHHDRLRMALENLSPHVIINAAAYTAVDKAESDVALAHAINAQAVSTLAEAAQQNCAFLVHYSTDYVFDGTATVPYGPEAATNPLSVYGHSKLAGEKAIRENLPLEQHLILRTQWVHQPGGRNFVATIFRAAQANAEMRIVADQRGTPCLADDLAAATWQALAQNAYGLHHYSNSGEATWFDFAEAIVALGRQCKPASQFANLRPISTADYPLPAKRPAFALLDKSSFTKATGHSPRHWHDALSAAWRETFQAS